MAATVPRVAVDGDVIWSERELAGTRPYRVTQLLRGVIIFGASGEELAGARF